MKFKVSIDWIVRNNTDIVVEADTIEQAEDLVDKKARNEYEALPWDNMSDEFYVRDGETKEVT